MAEARRGLGDGAHTRAGHGFSCKKTAEIPAGLGGSSGDEGMPLIASMIGLRGRNVFDVAQTLERIGAATRLTDSRRCSFAHGKVSGAASGCLTASAAAARSILDSML